MKIALLCDIGCEAIAALEVEELLKKKAKVKRGYVLFDASLKEVALLSYRSQSASRILTFIAEGSIKVPEDVKSEALLSFDYTPFLKGSFRVSCERHGEHEYQAREVEEELGTLLHEEKGFAVDLKDASMDVWCKVVDDTFVVGVDLTGRDLGKRDYKAFHTRKSLRATVAYAALRVAGYDGKKTLVDPFSTDGAIPIEAALFATHTSLQKFTKDFDFRAMPFAKATDWDAFFTAEDENVVLSQGITGFAPQVRTLKMARGNAKLAGVDKAFLLTKCEVGWLDTKFEEHTVDCIVTVPPASGKNTPLKDVEKLQDDLFYQSRYVLKPTGKVLLITEKKAEFLNAATRHKFSLKDEKVVHMGGTTLKFLVFEKG